MDRHQVDSQTGRTAHPARAGRRRLRRAKNATLVAVLAGVLASFTALAATGDITTVAGGGVGDGGPAASAALNDPYDLVPAPGGGYYVADAAQNRVRRVDASGNVTTVAGTGAAGSSGDGGPATSATLWYPMGLALDAAGNLYIADTGNNRVRKVATSGVITTVAGTGAAGSSGDGGPATSAQLHWPQDVVVDSAGNLYVADTDNNRVRKVDTSGTISAFAGTGSDGSSGDGGPATSAQLDQPAGLEIGAAGAVLIADTDNHRVRSVSAAGIITTIAGTGSSGYSGDGGPATSAQLRRPAGVFRESDGTLHIADSEDDRIRKVSPTGTISTEAGTGSAGFSGDGGAATSAQLRSPYRVVVDSGGNLLIGDTGNDRVRRVTPGGTITSAAGGGVGDGAPAASALLRSPRDVVSAPGGGYYIADSDQHRVRKVDPSGVVTTLAGTGVSGYSGDGGPASSAQLRRPEGVAVDASGNVFIADKENHRIRKVTTGGTITTVAGTGSSGYSGDGGPATSAQLRMPRDLVVAADGSLYIADSDNHRIRKVSPTGTITTVAGTGTSGYSGDGGPATSAQLRKPDGLELAASGVLYIADSDNNRVRKVSATGTITTIAGTTSGYSGDGGPATSAQLRKPDGLVIDDEGALYVADADNHRVRKISPTGIITTVAGTGAAGFSGDGGPASSAQLNRPREVDITPNGDLLIADQSNNRIRKMEGVAAVAPPVLTGASPASPANDNAPRITGTSWPGSTVKLYTNSTCTSAVAATGTDAQLQSPGLSVSVADDTTTTFYATATSAGGRVSQCSPTSVTYVEDSSPPAPPAIGTSPGSSGSDRTPTWGFTSESGATFECKLARGATVISDWASCASPRTYDLSSEPDGTYTFSVRAIDSVGNVGPVASEDYTLNSAAPPEPTITGNPGSAGNGRNPVWSFSGAGGLTFECRLTRGGTVVSDFASCTNPKSYDLTGEPDGTYVFGVRAIDGFGVRSSLATHSYTLDTVSQTPTFSSGPGPLGSGRNPEWAFTAESGASFECRIARGATIVFDWASCASPKSYDLAGQPDGAYTISVRATDAVGNVSAEATDTYTLDTTVDSPGITSGPNPSGHDRNPAWSFTGEAGATFQCRFARGDTVLSEFTACTSPYSYDLTAEPDDRYTVSVRAIDPAGNISAATVRDYTLDTHADAPTIHSGPGPLGRSRTPAWQFTAESGASFECKLARGETVVFDFASCPSPKTYDLDGQPDGTYTLTVRATDAAGNTSGVATDAYTLDTLAEAPRITSAPKARGSDLTPVWSFAGEAGATFECRLKRGSTVVSAFESCSSPKSYNLKSEPDGTYTFSVRAVDPAGNLSALRTDDYELDTAPAPTPEPDPSPARDTSSPSPPPAEPPTQTPVTPEPPPAPGEDESAAAVKEADARAEALGGRPHEAGARPPAKAAAAAAAAADALSRGLAGGDDEPRSVGEKAVRALKHVGKAAEVVGKKSAFPVALLGIVMAFLLAQNRIDRNDPKLRLAPVHADPDLSFGPPPPRPSGGTP